MNVAFVIFGVDGVVAGAKSESRSSGGFWPGHVGRGIQYNIRARVGIVAGSGLVGRAGPGETAKDQVRSGWARSRRSQAGSGSEENLTPRIRVIVKKIFRELSSSCRFCLAIRVS